MLHETKINQTLQQIVAIASPLRVILFGSAGRQERIINDLDFLVVISSSRDPRHVSRLLQRGVRRNSMPIDFVVVTEEEFVLRSDDISSVIFVASHEGKELYVAPAL